MPMRVTCGEVHLLALGPGQHSSEEMSQRWRAVGDTVSDLTCPGIEAQTFLTNNDDLTTEQTVLAYYGRAVKCFLIKIVGVAQVINKRVGAFTKKDEKIFASYLGFCGIAIHNAQLFEKLQLENRRNEASID